MRAKGSSSAQADKPIFWYRPTNGKKYRVIYADLSVRDAAAPPNVPARNQCRGRPVRRSSVFPHRIIHVPPASSGRAGRPRSGNTAFSFRLSWTFRPL